MAMSESDLEAMRFTWAAIVEADDRAVEAADAVRKCVRALAAVADALDELGASERRGVRKTTRVLGERVREIAASVWLTPPAAHGPGILRARAMFLGASQHNDEYWAKRFPPPTVHDGSRPSPSFDAHAMNGRESLPPKESQIVDDGWVSLAGDDRTTLASVIAESAAKEGKR